MEGRSSGLRQRLELNKFRHDARNELSLIAGYLDLLELTLPDSHPEPYIEKIRSAAGSLGRMIENLLNPS